MTFSHLLWVFLISAVPIVELRGAIPTAICVYDIPWYIALLVCFVGNLVPVPFIILLLDPVTNVIGKVPILKTIMDRVFERTRKRGEIVERWERLGLVLLVAIPLPGTGAWTGSLAAFLLGLGLKKAFPPIMLGVLIAGIIVTILSLAGLEVWWLFFDPE
ncbi:MAG: small multi-drug export protein [Chloroflexota bacterium]|nr:small multi-drug export protein [Chloroflexota bacterium]